MFKYINVYLLKTLQAVDCTAWYCCSKFWNFWSFKLYIWNLKQLCYNCRTWNCFNWLKTHQNIFNKQFFYTPFYLSCFYVLRTLFYKVLFSNEELYLVSINMSKNIVYHSFCSNQIILFLIWFLHLIWVSWGENMKHCWSYFFVTVMQ